MNLQFHNGSFWRLQAPPSIAVTSPLRHSSVNAAGHLLTPGLELWDAQDSRLADVVQEACNTLSSKPSAYLPLLTDHVLAV